MEPVTITVTAKEVTAEPTITVLGVELTRAAVLPDRVRWCGEAHGVAYRAVRWLADGTKWSLHARFGSADLAGWGDELDDAAKDLLAIRDDMTRLRAGLDAASGETP